MNDGSIRIWDSSIRSMKDYQKPPTRIWKAARSDAQIWMKVMGARADRGNALETSRLIWIEVYANTKDDSSAEGPAAYPSLDAALGLKN